MKRTGWMGIAILGMVAVLAIGAQADDDSDRAEIEQRIDSKLGEMASDLGRVSSASSSSLVSVDGARRMSSVLVDMRFLLVDAVHIDPARPRRRPGGQKVPSRRDVGHGRAAGRRSRVSIGVGDTGFEPVTSSV